MSDQNSPIGFNRAKAHATALGPQRQKGDGRSLYCEKWDGNKSPHPFCDDDWNRHGGAIASLAQFRVPLET